MNISTKINNYLSKYCIFIFAIITLAITLLHTPFWDETHAFEIARLKLSEIFYLAKVEGHTIFWYLILKPFSNLKFYPYSMYLINWLFCLSAVIILWKKAPFNPIQKTLISFSVPFLLYYSTIARCYSLGILFLFLICAFYKKRFKRPFLYSILIALCANTSVLLMIGAFFLGLLFLFEIIQKYINKTFSKKNLVIVLFIFFLGAFSILIQFFNLEKPPHELAFWFITYICDFIIFPKALTILSFIFHLTCTIAFYYFTFISFKTSKKAFFFAFSTFLALSLIFIFIYSGNYWNHFIYYVYFVAIFWIFKRKLLKNRFSKILFTLILFFMTIPQAIFEDGKINLIYSSKSKLITQQIIENKQLKNSKLYTLEWWGGVAPGATMFLEKNNVFVYDVKNRKRTSFESLKETFLMKKEPINFDEFYNSMDKNSYLLVTEALQRQKFSSMIVINKPNKDFIFKTKTKTYHLKLIESNEKSGLNIYKIYEL